MRTNPANDARNSIGSSKLELEFIGDWELDVGTRFNAAPPIAASCFACAVEARTDRKCYFLLKSTVTGPIGFNVSII